MKYVYIAFFKKKKIGDVVDISKYLYIYVDIDIDICKYIYITIKSIV